MADLIDLILISLASQICNIIIITPCSIDRFHCHEITKYIDNHPVEKAKKFWCYRRQQNKSLRQVLGLCILPNFRYSLKWFSEIYRTQYGNAMLVYLSGAPIWQPENSVNIWNLLWLSRRLIISTEQTSIYVSTFPYNLTSKKTRNHDMSIYIFNKLYCRLGSRTSITLNFKILWFPNEARYWAVKL